ncbi:hypothetical protein D9M68_235010 [compost metagenome]
MAPDDLCECDLLVWVPWSKRELVVRLAQLVGLASDEMTQAIADWQYWRDGACPGARLAHGNGQRGDWPVSFPRTAGSTSSEVVYGEC